MEARYARRLFKRLFRCSCLLDTVRVELGLSGSHVCARCAWRLRRLVRRKGGCLGAVCIVCTRSQIVCTHSYRHGHPAVGSFRTVVREVEFSRRCYSPARGK